MCRLCRGFTVIRPLEPKQPQGHDSPSPECRAELVFRLASAAVCSGSHRIVQEPWWPKNPQVGSALHNVSRNGFCLCKY